MQINDFVPESAPCACLSRSMLAVVTSASPAITGISKDGVMTYRTIIVELQADRFPAARLTAARALARRFGASLVGLHVMPPPFVPALWEGGGAVYLGPEIIATQTKAIQETKQRVKALFEEICGADPAVSWREEEGEPGRRVAEVARSADLVITTSAQAASDSPAGLAEGLLTAAGVPVLVLPPNYVGDGGRTALVGWDGSREATRAVHAALPFLQEARTVVLCAIGGRPGLDDASLMLQRHGVQVEPERVAGSDSDAGDILLARAVTHGADLLVMGAYGHTRLRELVFGGATRDVLKKAVLPVLFGS